MVTKSSTAKAAAGYVEEEDYLGVFDVTKFDGDMLRYWSIEVPDDTPTHTACRKFLSGNRKKSYFSKC